MRGQGGFDLGGIDVDPAADDHVRRPVSQVDEAVGVDSPHVTHREQPRCEVGGVGLRLVAVIAKRAIAGAGAAVQRADRPGWDGAAGLVDHLQLHAGQWSADRAGVAQRVGRVDRGERTGLAGSPVLGEHRTPPINHRGLGLMRDRRRTVQNVSERTGVEGISSLSGQPQHSHHHRGNQMGMGDAMVLDEVQYPTGVETIHHRDRRAVDQVEQRVAADRGVVVRAGQQMRT